MLLSLVLYQPTEVKLDDQRIAHLTQSAFVTVSDMAGRPPVNKIELYLVPGGYSLSLVHKS